MSDGEGKALEMASSSSPPPPPHVSTAATRARRISRGMREFLGGVRLTNYRPGNEGGGGRTASYSSLEAGETGLDSPVVYMSRPDPGSADSGPRARAATVLATQSMSLMQGRNLHRRGGSKHSRRNKRERSSSEDVPTLDFFKVDPWTRCCVLGGGRARGGCVCGVVRLCATVCDCGCGCGCVGVHEWMGGCVSGSSGCGARRVQCVYVSRAFNSSLTKVPRAMKVRRVHRSRPPSSPRPVTLNF